MSYVQEAKAVAKLTILTLDGTLKWSVKEPLDLLSADSFERVHLVYLCEHEGRKLRLYERKSLQYNEEFEKKFWSNELRLEIIDDNDRSLYSFPSVGALHDLWDAVQRQTSDVYDYIAQLATA